MYVYKWKHDGKCKAAVYFKKLSLTEATAERQGAEELPIDYCFSGYMQESREDDTQSMFKIIQASLHIEFSLSVKFALNAGPLFSVK